MYVKWREYDSIAGIEIGDSVYTVKKYCSCMYTYTLHICESDRRYIQCIFYMIVGTEGCVH